MDFKDIIKKWRRNPSTEEVNKNPELKKPVNVYNSFSKEHPKTNINKTPMVLFYRVKSQEIRLPDEYFRIILKNDLKGYTVKYKEVPGKGYIVQSEAMSLDDNRIMIKNVINFLTDRGAAIIGYGFNDNTTQKNEKLNREYRDMCRIINSYSVNAKKLSPNIETKESVELLKRALYYTVLCFNSLRRTLENGDISDKTTFNAKENLKKEDELFNKELGER